jgi:hypothetical protein
VRIRVRIGHPYPLVCRKRWLIGDPWESGLEQILHNPLCVVKADWMGRSFGWNRKNCCKSCKIFAYAQRLGLLCREGSLSCHTYCDTGHRFFSVSSKGASHSIASYNMHCDADIMIPICVIYIYIYNHNEYRLPARIQVRVHVGPPHPLVCRKRRLNGTVLRMRAKKPRPHVTAVVGR